MPMRALSTSLVSTPRHGTTSSACKHSAGPTIRCAWPNGSTRGRSKPAGPRNSVWPVRRRRRPLRCTGSSRLDSMRYEPVRTAGSTRRTTTTRPTDSMPTAICIRCRRPRPPTAPADRAVAVAARVGSVGANGGADVDDVRGRRRKRAFRSAPERSPIRRRHPAPTPAKRRARCPGTAGGGVPTSGPSTSPGSATPPRIIRETGARSHTELGDRCPAVRDSEEGDGGARGQGRRRGTATQVTQDAPAEMPIGQKETSRHDHHGSWPALHSSCCARPAAWLSSSHQ